MWRSFFKDKKWFYWSYGGGTFILVLLILQTYLDVLFNSWYKDFYDLLQKATEREVSEFYDGLFLFMKLAIPYVIIYTITNYFIILIFSAISIFFESILIIFSIFKKGILKKEILSKDTDLGFDLIIKRK